jgi:GT2 family glycosyltransferase
MSKDLMKSLALLEIKLAKAEQQLTREKENVSAKHEEIRGLKQIIKTVQSQHLSALEEIQRRGQIIKAVRDGFENSTSWKVTSPLRWVMKRLRGSQVVTGATDESSEAAMQMKMTAEANEPEIIPTGELQWLQRLKCHRNDYATWVSAFDERGKQVATNAEAPHLATQSIAVAGDRSEVFVSFVSVLTPFAVTQSTVAALEVIKTNIVGQSSPCWEWLIVADAAQVTALSEWSKGDPRLRMVLQDSAKAPAESVNETLLAEANGHYVCWLDASFILRPHALEMAIAAFQLHPNTHVFYADEDTLDPVNTRTEPKFYCDYNADLWLCGDPLGRFVLFQIKALLSTGGFCGSDMALMRHDLLLRMVECYDEPAKHILHLPKILSHRQKDGEPEHLQHLLALGLLTPQAVMPGAQGVAHTVQQHLMRRAMASIALPHPNLRGACRVRHTLPNPMPSVGIVIPTRDNVGVLSVCLDTLLELSTYPNIKVVLVDNGSSHPETLQYLESISNPRVKVIRDDAPFNFSRLVNKGAAAVDGEILCLLNNDMQITQPDWLEEMVGWAVQEGVAAVGARLWYGEGQLQHGGIVLGIQGIAGHAHKFLTRGESGYMNRAELHQTMSAVTGACMVVRRSVFEELGGFDEALGVAYNDVDFCLRASNAGYRNVWTPHAEMIHHESISRGFEDSPEKQTRFQREAALMHERWGAKLVNDPFYSPNLTLEHEDFGLAWPPAGWDRSLFVPAAI